MCLNKGNHKNDQTLITPCISKQWIMEPQHVKDYYRELSRRTRILFEERHGIHEKQTSGKHRLLFNNSIKYCLGSYLFIETCETMKTESHTRST